MKLYKLLFENVSSNQIIQAFKDMLNSNSETSKAIYFIGLNELNLTNDTEIAKSFYETNKNLFDRILKDAKIFKHIGAGAKGDAFNLGNQILKIERETSWNTTFSSRIRAEKAASSLFGKNQPSTPTTKLTQSGKPPKTLKLESKEDIANVVPMIYDQGTFTYPKLDSTNFFATPKYVELSWIIMEKFETLDRFQQNYIDDILDVINDELYNNTSLDDIINNQKFIMKYSSGDKLKIDKIGEELRLKSDWYEKLIQGMWNLKQKGITDFHSGNIGIRRSGAEGTLVFFD